MVQSRVSIVPGVAPFEATCVGAASEDDSGEDELAGELHFG